MGGEERSFGIYTDDLARHRVVLYAVERNDDDAAGDLRDMVSWTIRSRQYKSPWKRIAVLTRR